MRRLNKISLALLVTSPALAALSGAGLSNHVNISEFDMRNYRKYRKNTVTFMGAICL